jgi:hypothetical protein
VTTFRYNPDRGLFVPTAANPGVALAQASGYMHATIGWKELFPDAEPTTLGALTRLAAQLSAESILYLVSILQLVIRRRHGGDRATYLHDQLNVAKELFPANIYERVRLTAETTGSDTVIHPTQLLIAALLAVHFGKPGDRAQWDTAAGAELLLRISDALDVTGGQGDDSLLKLLIRRYGENRNEEERYLLGRYFDLFVQRPRAKWGHPSPFDRLFEQCEGYTIEEFLTCGYLLVRELLNVPSVAALQQIEFDQAIGRAARQLGHVPHAELVEADLVATPDWLRAHPRTRLTASSLALTNFEAFGEKPLMRVPSGGILPLSMPLFLQRLSIGLYWNLFEAASKDDAEHGVENLNAKVGELFQEYCTAALAVAATAGGATFIPESEIGGPEGRSKPDALLLEDRSLIVIEMTVSTLPMAVQVKGNVEGFRQLLGPEGPETAPASHGRDEPPGRHDPHTSPGPLPDRRHLSRHPVPPSAATARTGGARDRRGIHPTGGAVHGRPVRTDPGSAVPVRGGTRDHRAHDRPGDTPGGSHHGQAGIGPVPGGRPAEELPVRSAWVARDR